MDELRKVPFKIFSYNPETDSKPVYKDYEVELDKGTTILRAINYIKDHIDHDLSIRFFCQAGICGSCSVKVNGISKLACTSQVWDELADHHNEPIVIEPLNNFKVIRDLIVDIEPMWNKLEKYKSWVVPNIDEHKIGEKEFIVQEEDFQKINAATDCILCASCYSECTMVGAHEDFISPLVMLKMYRMNADERDNLNNERLQLGEKDHGFWDCTHCYRCVEVCVKSIPIMDAIHGVRHETFEKGMSSTTGYKHAKAFTDDIPAHGRLNEFTLPIRTLGLFGMISQIPYAITLGKKGRVPPLFPHKSENLEYVRDIFKRFHEEQSHR